MNTPSLYVLADEYRISAETLADLDLPDDVIADTLESISGDLEVKASNIAMLARNLESTAAQIKDAEAQLAARRKAIERRYEGIRRYLFDAMLHAGIKKIESPYLVLSIKNNPPSVVIDAENLLADEYMRIPPPPAPTPDKKAIAEAIKAGIEVLGAHLEQTQRLEIK